ncbi:NUDIX domain-containing protein [Bradyrhizobium erythrophlei]|uniref:Anti-CBASS protein Acb1 n=1 Tax=Bradyrhizobium erythrophlei TaxID=1437360 RepID=A0A1M5NP80_9BRAD|nr:NUDIX domain-containing protein [Bradyrhizobium erythrophlei]SHG91287.1 NUDIX domain-containing protein [Bradyrhizobium erythrophlei]
MTAIEKSTFAEPASATSGLQGYDLEGASNNKRTFYRHGGKITLGPEKCEEPDVEKQAPILAAGFALVTDEGKALFLKRSGGDGGDHAGEWCFPGGKIEPGETALQAAIRETFEEISFRLDPEGDRVEVCRVTLNGVDFTTFFQRVDEFEPKLDHEHTAFRWASVEKPPEPLHPGVRASLPLVISQAIDTTMKVAKGEKRTLYIKRRLRNAETLKQWADANGFPTTLTTDDMHVTIAYSREPVEWAQVPRSSQPIIRIEGGARTLDRLGKDGEALVLRFSSDDLASRHREIHDAGAVWSWPDYKPHITLTYQGEGLPLDRLVPWDGVLEFGPEEWAEVKENWMATVVEKSDAGEVEMDNLSLFVQLHKVDVEKQTVYGTAVEEVADRAGEIFDYATSKGEFEKWSGDIEKSTDGKSKGNVRAMHGKVAAGKLTDIGFDDKRKAIDVAAKIVDKDEWQKVLEGVYTGFSIGGSYLKRWTDGDLKRYTARPAEISLVDLPCVPTATFSIIKADGSQEMRKFQQPAADEPVTISNEAVAERATDLAKAAGDAGQWLAHIADARKQLEDEVAKAAEAAKVVEPVVVDTEVNKDGVTVDADAGRTTPDDVEQVWVSKRLPGATFAKKGDLAKALLELDAKEAAAAAAAPVLDALKAVTGTGMDTQAVSTHKDKNSKTNVEHASGKTDKTNPEKVDGRKPKGADTNVEATSGVKPAGNSVNTEQTDPKNNETTDLYGGADSTAGKRAPIESVKDLEIALKSHQPGQAGLAMKRHLIKAARTLGSIDLLPEGWVNKAEKVELEKAADIHFVADLLHMLACVECLEERAEFTSLWGGITVPKELTDRFGSALVEIGDIVSDMLDLVLNEIRTEEASEASKAAVFVDLLKRGARHSARDKAIIKKTHDHMVELDKSCCGGGMDKTVTVDVAKAAEIEAVTAENEQLKAEKAAHGELLKDIKAGIEAMTTKMATMETENAALKKSSEEIRVDLSAIRFTPAPVPPGTFRVIEKGLPIQDISTISDAELQRRGAEAQATRFMGPR